MRLIRPHFTIIDKVDGIQILKDIERIGRTCYKSESKITDDSYIEFVKNIIKRNHLSVIEHAKVSVRLVCSRGVSHEVVRHRIASFSQESTRYVKYNDIEVMCPDNILRTEELFNDFIDVCNLIERVYTKWIGMGIKPQDARCILPTDLKTEIVITQNLRQWRHFFELRASKFAHPMMEQIAYSILHKFKQLIPIVFSDISPDYNGSLIECKEEE